jgi:hypothetical protein
VRRAGLLLLLALIGFIWAVRVAVRSRNGGPPPPPDPAHTGYLTPPPTAAPRPPKPGVAGKAEREVPEPPLPDDGQPGPLRLVDDQTRKQGDFWLEQTLQLAPTLRAGPILDLYLSVNPDTLAGTRLRLTDQELRLERVAAQADGKAEEQSEKLASIALHPEAADQRVPRSSGQ